MGQVGVNDRSRHAPDDTCCLILRQQGSPLLHDVLGTTQTVLPHTRQHDAQRPCTVGLCGRAEQDVDGRTA